MYDDQLKAASLRTFDERGHTYQLQRRLIDTEQQLATYQGQYNHLLEHYHWTRRGFITILVFLSIALLVGWAMPLLHFGHLNLDLVIDPSSGEGFITLIVTCAALAGSIGYAIDRLWGHRGQSNSSRRKPVSSS